MSHNECKIHYFDFYKHGVFYDYIDYTYPTWGYAKITSAAATDSQGNIYMTYPIGDWQLIREGKMRENNLEQ